MHLHSLEFQAVGPFPGRHRVDFADLAAGGLFLLEGPTGSGKSTLIDMVVFALYGKVASKEASDDRLRSAHAEPGTETFVDLVLETGSGMYRVRRTPAYQRPKQRGTGTTLQQAGVKLWRLTDPDRPDHGELLSNRLDEAGDELKRLLGLDRDQFVQTVVLPQGEFAGFLRSRPEERRGLLQKVFGTAVYEQVQKRLEEMRAEARRDAADAVARVREAVAAFAGAADLDEEQADAVTGLAEAAPLDADSLTEAVTAHAERRLLHAEQAIADAEDARQVCEAATAARDSARTTATLLERRDRLRAELTDLESRAEDVTTQEAKRDAARAAAVVHDACEHAEAAAAALADAEAALVAARDEAPADLRDALVDDAAAEGVGPASATATHGLRDALQAERDRCTALAGELAPLAEVEAALPARREEVHRLEVDLSEQRVALAQAQDARDRRAPERAALEDRTAAAREGAAARPGAEAVLAAAEERLGAVEDVATLTVDLAAAERALDEAVRVATAAVDHERAVRTARLRGIAGELAAALVPGEPCGVCGSPDHPAPARLDADHVDAEQVEEAEEVRARAEAVVAERSTVVTALRERLDQRRAAAGGLDPEQAKAAVLLAQQALGRARDAETAVRTLTEQLLRFDEQTDTLRRQVAALEAGVAKAEGVLGERRDALARHERDVTAALDGCATVRDRRDLLTARARATRTWLDALTARDGARRALADAEVTRDAALTRTGLPDVATARAAHVPPRELAALEDVLARYAQALARVTHALAEPDIAGLAADAVVDVAAAEATQRAAEERARTLGGAAARAEACAEQSARAARHVTAALAASAEVRERTAPVIRMADLAAAAGADNGKQLTLATYVLARRFEDVVAAANHRLTAMSGGRFELVRSEEKEAVRARRTGLAMKVVDHHTGTDRDPRTLSGGETFYVSLCLALGLADVVTAEAGGTDMGTLFVDEGFGTLDPETLEVVLAELGRLRDGGRVVGVVSHVEALKQSIAERIEVRRRPGGGSTLTVRA